MPGIGELLIILLIVMVVFGAAKLPQLGDGLGKAIGNFRRAVRTDGAEHATEVAPKLAQGKDTHALHGD